MTLGNRGNTNIVKDLTEKSEKLVDINDEFLQVRHKNSIGVLSCFEQVDSYNGQKVCADLQSQTRTLWKLIICDKN